MSAPAPQVEDEPPLPPPEDDPHPEAGDVDAEAKDDDNADEGPDGCEDDGMRRVRCDGCDKEFLHLLTRKPADPIHCETCMRSKSRNVKKLLNILDVDLIHVSE